MIKSPQPSGSVESIAQSPDGFLAPFGVRVDENLLRRALTHRSWAYENANAPHNERLEFLGDSVLGLAVTTRLYRLFPNMSEGELAKRRAALVSTVALARAARRIELGKYLLLGKGELKNGGADKDSILADAMEAVIGAVYLSTDVQIARRFVLQLLEPQLAEVEALSRALDPKTTLQELAAAQKLPHPRYEVTSEGPDHNRSYTALVRVLGVTGVGVGSSKKVAELAAARDAVAQLTPERASADA